MRKLLQGIQYLLILWPYMHLHYGVRACERLATGGGGGLIYVYAEDNVNPPTNEQQAVSRLL